jgi:hypothetical protein
MIAVIFAFEHCTDLSTLLCIFTSLDGSFNYVSVIQTVLRSPELAREKMDKLNKNHSNELSGSMKV